MTKARKPMRTTSHTEKKSGVSPLLLGGVAIAALLIVLGLIYLGNSSSSSNVSSSADTSTFPTKGSADAPVTVIEFSDFGCPHCRDYVLDKSEQLIADYVDTGVVKYVVHPFHLGTPDRALAVEAAWCAADQEKFFEYQRALYENFGTDFSRAYLSSVARDVGLNTDDYEACMSNGTHTADVESARQAAVRQGVNSTPTFFINNQKVEGNRPYETFKQVIEQEAAIAQ